VGRRPAPDRLDAGEIVAREVLVATRVADRAEAVTADLLPIVDGVPGPIDAWVATGWSGHGFAIAPVVAELLIGWIVSDRRPALLEPFGLARFGWRS